MLKHFVEIQGGYPFRAGIRSVADGSVFAVQMRDVQPGQSVQWNEVIRTELDDPRESYWLREGDVLFVAKGNRYFAACLTHVPPKTVSSPHMYVLRVNEAATLAPEFLAWQINQRPSQQYLNQAAVGTNQLSIRRAALESMPFAVPALDKQHQALAMAKLALDERIALEKLIKNRQQQLDVIARRLLSPN